jgi:hypothetical protein
MRQDAAENSHEKKQIGGHELLEKLKIMFLFFNKLHLWVKPEW